MSIKIFALLLLTSITLSQEKKVCFYTEQNYNGNKLCAKEGENVDIYFNHVVFNDDFESLKVPVGLQVLVFVDDSFHGRSEVFARNTNNLGMVSNEISSFIVQPARVCFYTDTHFVGNQFCATVGAMIDLESLIMLNNNFESVQIPPGLLVKAFSEKGFVGRFTWFRGDNVNLGDFNNIISSFILDFDDKVCFYTEYNFKGQSLCANVGTTYDIYRENIRLNDRLSSVLVPNGLFVVAFFDDGLHGHTRLFTEHVPNLMEFNDQISSFVVGSNGIACFYSLPQWNGDKICVTNGVGIGNVTSPFQSIIVPNNIQIQTFRHPKYVGAMSIYQTTTRYYDFGMVSSFNVTYVAASLYDNFTSSDIMGLENAVPFNLTVCSYINDQGIWKLLYEDNCNNTVKQYACNNIHTPNLWKVSSASGLSSEGGAVCETEFGFEYVYGAPSSAHSNSLLRTLIPTNGIWINQFYDAFSNSYSHRLKRNIGCGGPKQRACTYDDSYFHSWICSLPLISLFACTEPYCQEGMTREKILMTGTYICKCPSNHRVKRGPENATLGTCRITNLSPQALTGEEIVDRLLRNPETRNQLETAWTESFLGTNLYQEMGGYIYADPNNPARLQIFRAQKSASRPFRACETVNPSIDLNRAANGDVNPEWILVANFHTHPIGNNQEPSSGDIRNAIARGVPGIVISRRMIFVYGPERRANFLSDGGNSRDYPNDGDDKDFDLNHRLSVRNVRENPFPSQDEL